MGRKRQKTRQQLELAFTWERKGEALRPRDEGSELPATFSDAESSASCGRLMEEVCEPENLRKALRQVCRNHGAAGVDGVTTKRLPGYLMRHWARIRRELLGGTYKPQPVRRVEIEKPGGGMRKLGIPTVVDRFIQQAVLQVLQERIDRTFSEHSFGFRPGRSAHEAVAQAQEYIGEGYDWVVDIDLEKFFDRVNHDMLMGRLAKRISDKRVLRLVRAFLNAGVMEEGLVSPTTEGTPQGGPLSPLLSNLVLDDLDKELEKRGHRFVRYADDCDIYVRSERAGRRVMDSLSRYIAGKLKLKVNEEKSAVGRPWERKFLGFSFRLAPEPKRQIAPSALKRFRDRVRKLTRGTRGRSLSQVIEDLSSLLRGWRGYFGFTESPSQLRGLDGWVRRRLRCLVWKQWKHNRKRHEELCRRGVGRHLAARLAGSHHGAWRLSRSKAIHVALPKAYFKLLGLPTLAPTQAA